MIRNGVRLFGIAVLSLLANTAFAQETSTLTKLLQDGYKVVGAAMDPTHQEHFLYLQKDTNVWICFIASAQNRIGCSKARG